jgi:hypothetical protein
MGHATTWQSADFKAVVRIEPLRLSTNEHSDDFAQDRFFWQSSAYAFASDSAATAPYALRT